MLGDVGRYDDWLAREDPSEAAQRIAAYAAPSVLFDTSDQPVSEIRSVALPVCASGTDTRTRQVESTYSASPIGADALSITVPRSAGATGKSGSANTYDVRRNPWFTFVHVVFPLRSRR